AIGRGHRLAQRETVDVEELADWTVLDSPPELPEAFRHGICPPFTPLGRPLRREPGGRTYQEALHRVASGKLIWATHEGLFRLYRHPGVIHRPQRHGPRQRRAGLAHRHRDREDPRLHRTGSSRTNTTERRPCQAWSRGVVAPDRLTRDRLSRTPGGKAG